MVFPGVLDLYEFCTTSYKEQLDVARKKLEELNEEQTHDEAKGKEKTEETGKTAMNSTPEQVGAVVPAVLSSVCSQERAPVQLMR